MAKEITWTDAEEIGIQLQEKYPEVDPLDRALHGSQTVRDRPGRLCG